MRLLRLVLFFQLFFAAQGGFALNNNPQEEEITPIEKKINTLLERADKLKYEDIKLGIRLVKEAEELALKEINERKLGEVYTAYGAMFRSRCILKL